MADKLVTGYQGHTKKMAEILGDGEFERDRAKALWNAGYRFDPEARIQWLVVHLRANMDTDLTDAFRELCELIGIDHE